MRCWHASHPSKEMTTVTLCDRITCKICVKCNCMMMHWSYLSISVLLPFWLIPGHIHQVKENLSKTPQDLIPAVFPNAWGILSKLVLTLSSLYWACKSHGVQELSKSRPGLLKCLLIIPGLPGAFQAALHGVLTAQRYEQAVRDTMSCGGCTCSRGSFIGACLGAQVCLYGNIYKSLSYPSFIIYLNSSRLDLRGFQLPGHPGPCAMSLCWSTPRK